MAEEQKDDLGQFKSQPWILFDKIAARSFLIGDSRPEGLAIGSQNPAINANGEMVFFQDRTEAQNPTYTNMDAKTLLSYGFEVWGASLELEFPTQSPYQANKGEIDPVGPVIPGDQGPSPNTKLAEALINFGVVTMELGQENQARFPASAFSAGGGLFNSSFIFSTPQNALPQAGNLMKFPEPVEMPRTQNIAVKLKIAPEAYALIGTPIAPGVGVEYRPYRFSIWTDDPAPVVVELPQLPYAVLFKLVGRRIKFTQYGQVPGNKQV